MVRWLYFEGMDALRKWLEEVIELHDKWRETDVSNEYRRVLKLAMEFKSYIYSRKCFGYMLILCERARIVALCRDGDTITPVDVEEWLEYADL
jgi:hypothetical protein